MPRTVIASGLYRVLDANLNRAREGLRVCEDTARFVLGVSALASGYKRLRHDLAAAAGCLDRQAGLAARDVRGDRGRKTIASESIRRDAVDIAAANAQRVKESLRVLEEFGKLVSPAAGERFKALRYRMYDLEKKTFVRLRLVSDSRR